MNTSNMNSRSYGYARVSAKDQNLSRQMAALEEFGVENVFYDKQSGKDFQRADYRKLLRKVKQGDVIVIKSIDRLGRNYDEILEQWRFITKRKGVDIVVLDMPLLDTRKKDGDLTGTLISDLVLQILSYVAEMERTFIKQRQAEGIQLAKEKGVKFGRPKRAVPPEFEACREKFLAGEMSVRKAATACGLPQTTFYDWIKNY